ncbi:MAG: long-chain fatty acid--CoA ligase [Candidatus Abyssobacteria bacterium SURF_17]|uniref:Long-chain fatty acid--CoA ligase n=1 Tax=Candidatus Abyssobacteria bacterium SURF_17 TaxID=2093361 RepID=A0A419EV68_9BACT|nr:MAG: long-chain fatty acid--CoA ligase [Candidatus Abyssubacteria bacterium SURF_17]
MKSETIAKLFQERVRLSGDRLALKTKVDGRWSEITWNDYTEKVRCFALGLTSLGLQPGDVVSILGNNLPEWLYADIATMSLGAVTVPIYQTNTAEQVKYILDDSGAKFAVVQNKLQLDKVLANLGDLPALKGIIVIEMQNVERGDVVISFEDVLALGREYARGNSAVFEERMEAVTPDTLATIIYTSGTTGPPKGTMLTHANLIAHARGQSQLFAQREDDITVSFLPLAHVGERMLGHINRIYTGNAAALAESIEKLLENLQEIKPTYWGSVPRPYEKIYTRILSQVESSPPLRKALFKWALNVGMQANPYREKKKPLPLWLKLRYQLADALVYKKIRALFGGRCRFFVVGAAPISFEIERFFQALSINMLPLYGMTEATGIITTNTETHLKMGTVGKALPGVELKLAEDGELLARGSSTCIGYFKKPQDTEALLADGWLHTGDIATIDDEGFVKIVDRKKDILVTSGGKNVAPQNIENLFKASPYISQVMVYGDRKNYLTALFTLNEAEITTYAREKGIEQRDFAELTRHPEIVNLVQSIVDEKNQHLARFETIKKFVILPHDLSQAANEITPTMKVKRKVVTGKYGHLLDRLYQ